MWICRYELSKVIEELKALNADIIGLQEVDIGCERSNNVDTGAITCSPLTPLHFADDTRP